MDEKQYAKRALILAVTSFALSNSLLLLAPLRLFLELFIKSEFPNIFGPMALLGLSASLPIAVIAYRMGKRMKGSFTMINLTRILPLLAIIESLLMIFALLLPPRGY